MILQESELSAVRTELERLKKEKDNMERVRLLFIYLTCELGMTHLVSIGATLLLLPKFCET